MQYPGLTAAYGAILALVFVVLSLWVIAGRWRYKVNLGEGGAEMQARVRAHANFIEYVPLVLLLVGLLEMAHTSSWIVHTLLLPLVIARLIHPFGLMTAPATPNQFALRGAPILVTIFVLTAAAVLILVRAL